MNQFLLLRSNKQSGPYSADELRQMGLKPYDLIWVDGKSAAWRYPGEIEDLKSFAPPVEEQPYDRFYKKSTGPEQKSEEVPQENAPAISVTPARKTQPALPAEKPVEKAVNKKAKEYKRVFVTLPSGAQVQAKENAEPVKEQTYQPPIGEDAYPEEKTTYLTQQAQKPADIYYPGKRTSRRKIFPLAAVIIGMIAMVALGIVIGMYIDNKPVLSSKKNTENPNKQEQITISQPQANETNTNTTANETVPQSISNIDSVKQQVTKIPVVKKKKVAPAVDSTSKIVYEPVKTGSPIVSEDATVKRPLNRPMPDFEKLVSVTNNDYQVGPFGGISRLALTLTNTSAYELSLVVVQVQYLKVNKEVFKTENIYFRDVAANSSLTVNAPRSNRGNTINYKVTLINSKDHLYHAGN